MKIQDKTLDIKTKLVLFCLASFSLVFTFVPNVEGQEWARKMFKETDHDFGKVPMGQVPEHRFEIQNIYREPIHIQSVTSSCGCTIVSATKKTLKTWEKAEIVCKYNTPAVDPGKRQATITVLFSGQFRGECQLNVKGVVVGGLLFEPESLDFGQGTKGNLPEQKIRLTHTGSPDFRLVDIKSSYGHIKIRKGPTIKQGNNVSIDLIAELKDSTPTGYCEGELVIVYQKSINDRDKLGNPVLRKMPLKFSAKVCTPLQVAPKILNLGSVTPGQTIKKKIFLAADVPFKISDVRCRNTAFAVSADETAKKLHIVEVTYTGNGNQETGKQDCELAFFTDLGSQADEKNPSGSVKVTYNVSQPINSAGESE